MGVIVGGVAFSPISIPSKVNVTCNSLPCLKIGRSKGRIVVSKFSGGNGHIELSGEQLKSQLESLQREADQTIEKANSTRARFMRLTEAVDKLQLQALANVKAGKESAAREMLLQKKKVMQALENSKRRAELLDELLKKIGEAISEKEAQLIKLLATTRLEKDIGKDSEGPVRVVSSTEGASFNNENLEEHFESDSKKIDGNEKELRTNMTGATESESQINQERDSKELLISDTGIRYDHLLAVLKGIDSYQSLLIDLDQQIAEMETKLQVLHKFSSLLLEDEAERLSNRKVKATIEILEALQNARARIAGALSQVKTSM
ncbi:hypothetical protein SUGI_0058930 [Cryptomeria japonica]|uniref:uncharacterized protein LOC131064168 n=1 Tax=Cryptomeria japonica TaxID=3369 RepID=UPI002408CFB1|nr:uncharacterized protein LOC131064168 [Cryptomeria japonica]GLJ07123.1 hypothetical protein SUGI_0058930 [Cryptomeria japonica]